MHDISLTDLIKSLSKECTVAYPTHNAHTNDTNPEVTFDSSEFCLLFARRDWMSREVEQLSALHRETLANRPMSARYQVNIFITMTSNRRIL